MIESIFKLSECIRYVAVYKSDRYEELLVNPTLLKLASQRGNIDCGGLDYILVRYGNFFQFVLPESWGHVSVCLEANTDPIQIGAQVKSLVHDAS